MFGYDLCIHGLHPQECFICNMSIRMHPPIKINRDRRFDQLDSVIKKYPKISPQIGKSEKGGVFVPNFKLNPYIPISELKSLKERRGDLIVQNIYDIYINSMIKQKQYIENEEGIEVDNQNLTSNGKITTIEDIERKFIRSE